MKGRKSDSTLKICELFISIQGEGTLIGTPMNFIRLSGCKRNATHRPSRRVDATLLLLRLRGGII